MVEENSNTHASSLRNILSVMEERAHLGLDDEAARNLRQILTRRIARVESGAVRPSWYSDPVGEEEAELSLKA